LWLVVLIKGCQHRQPIDMTGGQLVNRCALKDKRVVFERLCMSFRPIDTFRFDEAGRIVQMRAYFGPANISRA